MSILQWLKKEEVAGLPDPNKQQNAEMKSIVVAANDAVRPVQSVVSKKGGDYTSYVSRASMELQLVLCCISITGF